MKDLRVEITDGGAALYLAVDPDGLWAKTTQPDKLITVDWDRQGRVIGIEALGSVAQEALTALIASLAEAQAEDPEGLRSALEHLVSGERGAAKKLEVTS